MIYVILGAVAASFLYILYHGAPYVPSNSGRVQEMVKMLEVNPGERIADLGSGDGRLVIACAEAGAEAHGYEVNPLLVWKSRREIRKLGLQDTAFIHLKSFLNDDLGQYDACTIFQIKSVMHKLEEKFENESKKPLRVVVNAFGFPTKVPIKNTDTLFLYTFKNLL
jgi:ribosomal protein L11 methylase PrmA